ncbi:MAG: alpha/beta hydrolase [Oscillibacter sp.]|nr:alpha/beta hydrolase [Oscillibacter sp.]
MHYLVNGVKAAANVYTPAGYEEQGGKKYPAVTVAHPNGGVKEQVSGLFAQKLAENGYIAIACDAAYQGASEGEPRNTDLPANRVEDIHAMVDFLVTFPGVDEDRIGLFGICGGGGYTLKAAQTEKRAKAVATLSAFNTGIVRLYGLGNSQVDTIQQRLAEAAAARSEEAKTGKVVYPAPRGQITQEYIDSLPDGLYKDGMYYYGRDYAHPNSGGQPPVKNLLDLVDFDARQNIELITQPLLMMGGSEADTLYMTKDCFALATGTEHKELFIIEGARHIPTYFVPEFVEKEANKLMEFFGKYL